MDESPDSLFRRACALDEAGRLEEAAAAYRLLLEREPRHAAAHNNLGSALQAMGRFAEAGECFARAAEADPSSPFFAYNLGTALQATWRLPEAIGEYRRALGLRPGFAEAHANLAGTLAAAARFDEALASFAAALMQAPALASPALTARIAGCLREAPLEQADENVRRLLVAALAAPWARPIDLATAAVRLLRREPGVGPALRDDALLRALLENAPVTDVAIEAFLAQERRAMLDAALSGPPGEPSAFEVALARQCRINDFVYACSADEEARAATLREALARALAAGGEVRARDLVAAAAYAPLRTIPGAEGLARRAWRPDVRSLVAAHIDEPMQEQALRERIPRLTPIGDGVSQAVRAQYEEHPYPRWTRVPAPPAPVPLDAFLRERFPHAGKVPAAAGRGCDVLVAGCGTGREPIELARAIAGARVLAVDLSAASLAYAQRKAIEHGVANLELAQADILALGSLGRSFDLVSSVGVLHHLDDPAAGLRVLVSLLRPGGWILLGFYSETGRHAVVAARRHIAERGYAAGEEGIRRMRADVMSAGAGSPLGDVAKFVDFYSMPECRDLLFHVKEHRFTLPQVQALLAAQSLELQGLLAGPEAAARYAERFPGDSRRTDLERWDAIEREMPSAFAGMYLLAARKGA